MGIDRPPSPYKRLIAHRAATAQIEYARKVHPGFHVSTAVIACMADGSINIPQTLRDAKVWVDAAILAVQQSKGGEHLTREQACERLVGEVEARRS